MRRHKPYWWAASGLVVGVLATRWGARPGGRRIAREILRHAFALKDALEEELELLREDAADLVAEARAEHEETKAAAAAAGEPADPAGAEPAGS
jgi:hypothetical protein